MTVSGQSDGHLRQFDDGIVARDDDDVRPRPDPIEGRPGGE
jgi:hypothetical protein